MQSECSNEYAIHWLHSNYFSFNILPLIVVIQQDNIGERERISNNQLSAVPFPFADCLAMSLSIWQCSLWEYMHLNSSCRNHPFGESVSSFLLSHTWVFSKGLQRVILWLTARHGISTCSTNKGSDSGFLLPILVFSRQKRYSSKKSSLIVVIYISITPCTLQTP